MKKSLSTHTARGRESVAVCLAILCLGLAGCGKPFERIQPGVRVDAGWDDYRLGEFSLALKEFQAASADAIPGSAVHLEALYGEATTWCLRRPDEDLERAARLFHEVIDLAPTNSMAAWSWLALARIKALPVDGEAPALRPQLDAYQEVIRRFPFHAAGEEAFLMQQAAKLGTPDATQAREALAALQEFIKTHSGSPWRCAAYGLIVHCCTILGLDDLRLEAMMQAWKTAEIDPINPVQDLSWTYWQIATIAEFNAGDFATAREYYRKLIAEYPTEQRVFLAKQELKRMDDLEARLRAEGTAP